MNGNQTGRVKRRETRKTALYLLAALMILAGALFVFRSAVNRYFLFRYESADYSEYPEKILLPLALGENHVVPGNLGNAAYQRGEYELAAEYFRAALKRNPPAEGTECALRVNLALSILHTYPFETVDRQDSGQVDEAVKVLLSARSVLTEHGCACEESGASSGHSEEAENLKRDIDGMLAKLTAPPPPPPKQNSGDRPDGGGESDGPAQGSGDDDSQQSGPEGTGEEEQTQKQKQQALQEQLEQQKQSLETGTYQSGDRDFTYIDISEQIGYGEGAPW